MIAGISGIAIRRAEIAQRLHVRAPRRERAVDEVARDDDEVDPERVAPRDDPPCPFGRKQAADVEVG